MDVPFTPFQQFQELNEHLLNQPYTRQHVRMYRNGTSANLNIIRTDRNNLIINGHQSPTSEQLRNLNREMASYMRARKRADRILKGLVVNVIPEEAGRMKRGGSFSMNSERETTDGNLRMFGGAVNVNEYLNDKWKIPEGNEEKNPAIHDPIDYNDFDLDEEDEDEEEEYWDYPYRFTNEFYRSVEHIWDLIWENKNEEALRLYLSSDIRTIWREDYQRLLSDKRQGMILDRDEKYWINQLKNMIIDIKRELKFYVNNKRRREEEEEEEHKSKK
jgi:hypothetical protein